MPVLLSLAADTFSSTMLPSRYCRRGRHHHHERVAQPHALADHVEGRPPGEFRANAQAAVGPLNLRFFQVGEVTLVALVVVDVAAAVLREHGLRDHALERADTQVQFHGARRGRAADQKHGGAAKPHPAAAARNGSPRHETLIRSRLVGSRASESARAITC